jgi:hypothetical protein
VGHLSEGKLRRLYDEPLSGPASEREHYAGCATCQARYEHISEDARAAAELMAVPEARVNVRSALAHLEMPDVRRPPAVVSRLSRFRFTRPLQAAGIAAVLVVAFAVAGISQGLIPVVQPAQKVQVVQVSPTDVNVEGLPNLSSYGTSKVIVQPELKPGSAADAAALGLSLPDRSSLSGLPSNVPTEINYAIVSQGKGSFTFDAAKAAAAAAAAGKPAPVMPAGMDGSTLTLTVGPAAAEIFGPNPLTQAQAGQKPAEEIPALVIAKANSPVVDSTGVTASQLESFLASQPGISPALAAQIKAIGDPITSLPIIVPVDKASATQVTLSDGTSAVVVGDNTGLGSAVIWVKNGIVYGVGGSLTKEQNLAIANQVR